LALQKGLVQWTSAPEQDVRSAFRAEKDNAVDAVGSRFTPPGSPLGHNDPVAFRHIQTAIGEKKRS
jgi:hypothetical protein